MKKIITILTVLVVLCSSVVYASAESTTYEGIGFTIAVPEEYIFKNTSSGVTDISYWVYADDSSEYADSGIEIEIFLTKADDTKAEFEYSAEGEEVVTFAGRPAIVDYDTWDDLSTCTIYTYTNDYLYEIECMGSGEAAVLYAILENNFKFTEIEDDNSVVSPTQEDKNDIDDKKDSTDTSDKEDEDKTDSDNITVIIVAAAAVVIVLAVCVTIIVVSKKKR